MGTFYYFQKLFLQIGIVWTFLRLRSLKVTDTQSSQYVDTYLMYDLIGIHLRCILTLITIILIRVVESANYNAFFFCKDGKMFFTKLVELRNMRPKELCVLVKPNHHKLSHLKILTTDILLFENFEFLFRPIF